MTQIKTDEPNPFLSVSSVVPTPEEPDFRTLMLDRYMPDGRLLMWPRKFKRQYVIIEAIARRFAPGVEYTEPEVNEILKAIYPHDHCTLRRYLVDLRFISRKNGIYVR